MGTLLPGARLAALAASALISVALTGAIAPVDAKEPRAHAQTGKSAKKAKHGAGRQRGPKRERAASNARRAGRATTTASPRRSRAAARATGDAKQRKAGGAANRGRGNARKNAEATTGSPPPAAADRSRRTPSGRERAAERRAADRPARTTPPDLRARAATTRRAALTPVAEDAVAVLPSAAQGAQSAPAAAAVAPEAEAAAAEARRREAGERDGRRAEAERRERGPVYRVLAPQVVDRFVEVIPARIRWVVAGLAAIVVMLLFGALLTAARGRRVERHRAHLLEEVGLLQRTLLPEVPERLGGLRASVAYRPADGPGAGGDFYDVFRLGDGRVGIVLGDVSGHGREVLGRTASLRYTLRAYLEAGLEPRAALRIAGQVLDRDFDAGFATVALAVHDGSAGTLTYATAGHPPPLVSGPSAHDPVTAAAAPPVGAGLATGQRQTVVAFPRGAGALFFTDGLVEARTDQGMLGREGLAAMLGGLGRGASAQRLLDGVRASVEEANDDMAVCLVRAERGAPTSAAARVEELALGRGDLATSTLQRFLWACDVPGDDAGAVVLAAQHIGSTAASVVVRVRIDTPGAAPEVEVLAEQPASLVGTLARAY